MAGISKRTLRYYDQIGLLSPKRSKENGYRIYESDEVDALQQILFFKELGLDLSTITQIMKDPSFNRLEALKNHLTELELRKNKLNLLIQNVKKTICSKEGEYQMKDTEKFQGLKQAVIKENEASYGEEIRNKYGDACIDESHEKLSHLTKEEYDAMEALSHTILEKLEMYVKQKEDYRTQAGKEIASLHRDWLSYTWSSYSPKAHKGLAELYITDERFTSYYDRNVAGCALFLKNSICYHM